jgi:translation initiation factor IF-3
MSTKRDIKTRPQVTLLKQNVSPRLLAVAEPEPEKKKAKTSRKNTPIKKSEPVLTPEKVEPRKTFALRYSTRYLEKLDQLFFSERSKGRKVTKAALVEEALDLLFEQYKL